MSQQLHQIKGYKERYAITRDGKVWSYPKRGCSHNGMFLTQTKDGFGYRLVGLYKNNKARLYRVHRLVADQLIKHTCEDNVVNHINGIKSDNRIENLEWCTRGENITRAAKAGLMCKGEKQWKSRLTEQKVLDIREMLKAGMTQASIAELMGVGRTTITQINLNHNWKHI